jgi:hypothetical protein
MGELFSGAMGVLRGFLTFLAVLLVLFIVGVATHKGATGMAAVGDGLGELLKILIELFTGAIKALSNL